MVVESNKDQFLDMVIDKARGQGVVAKYEIDRASKLIKLRFCTYGGSTSAVVVYVRESFANAAREADYKVEEVNRL